MDRGLSSLWNWASPSLNGIGLLASDWIHGLERLTTRRDLRFLTLMPWKSVLDSGQLFRRWRAFCPLCYHDMRERRQPIYEPLLWTTASLTVCIRHQRHLLVNCIHPSCSRRVPPLDSRSRPGHCSWCGGWLGANSTTNDTTTPEELNHQEWVERAIGSLIAHAPQLPSPPRRNCIAQMLTEAAERHTNSNIRRLARLLGTPYSSTLSWQRGRAIPQVPFLLHLCRRFDLLPLHLFTESARLGSLSLSLSHEDNVSIPSRHNRTPVDAARARAALELALASEELPPPSVRKVAAHLGCYPPALMGRFPELCHAVSSHFLKSKAAEARSRVERLCEQVRAAILGLRARSLYPSFRRVNALVPHFHRCPEAKLLWRRLRSETGQRPHWR